jgi:hypothetical protein
VSIPSYKVEGRGHNRRTTLTFYGTEPPESFAAMGAEYRRVRKCRMIGAGTVRCSACGRAWNGDSFPKAGEFCLCGAEVIG